MIVEDGNYFIYRHIRLDTNQVFYVGFGTKVPEESVKDKKWIYKRAYDKLSRNKFWKNVVAKTNYKVEILLETDDYEFLKKKEIEFIALYKKRSELGTLVNLTNGGDGSKGTVKPILMLDLNFNIIKEFDSVSEAARFLNKKVGELCRLIKKVFVLDNHIFVYKNEHYSGKIYDYGGREYVRGIKIEIYDSEFNFIKEFRSIKEGCIWVGDISFNSITQALKNNSGLIRGYYWVKKGQNPKNKKYKLIKRVASLDENGEIINIYANPHQATKILGLSPTIIYKHCKGQVENPKFKYIE